VQPSKENLPEVRLSEQALQDIENRMAKAVGDGIRFAMTEENARAFWLAAMSGLQKSATENTGRFVLGGIRAIFRKLFFLALLGCLAYMAGGWTLLVAVYKAATSSGMP
jgi:hypothetical protein